MTYVNETKVLHTLLLRGNAEGFCLILNQTGLLYENSEQLLLFLNTENCLEFDDSSDEDCYVC